MTDGPRIAQRRGREVIKRERIFFHAGRRNHQTIKKVIAEFRGKKQPSTQPVRPPSPQSLTCPLPPPRPRRRRDYRDRDQRQRPRSIPKACAARASRPDSRQKRSRVNTGLKGSAIRQSEITSGSRAYLIHVERFYGGTPWHFKRSVTSLSPEDCSFGGGIASPESWAILEKEWKQLLPLAPLGPDLERNFKFSEMINAGQYRIEHMRPFAKLIEDHVPMTLSLHLRQRDIDRAKMRVNIPPYVNLDWRRTNSPYMLALCHVVKWFTENADEVGAILKTSEPIDFIFDERGEKKFVQEAWNISVESLPFEERERFGKAPAFANDKEVVTLQAADYLAG